MTDSPHFVYDDRPGQYVYRGRSGQLWFEHSRNENEISISCESNRNSVIVLPLSYFASCGFELAGWSEDGETLTVTT